MSSDIRVISAYAFTDEQKIYVFTWCLAHWWQILRGRGGSILWQPVYLPTTVWISWCLHNYSTTSVEWIDLLDLGQIKSFVKHFVCFLFFSFYTNMILVATTSWFDVTFWLKLYCDWCIESDGSDDEIFPTCCYINMTQNTNRFGHTHTHFVYFQCIWGCYESHFMKD